MQVGSLTAGRCAPVGPQAWLWRERRRLAARCGGAQHFFVLRGGIIRAQCEDYAAALVVSGFVE